MRLSRLPAATALLALCALIGAPSSHAQNSKVCSGTISGSPLRPIANPLSVSLDRSIDAMANPAGAEKFLAGVRGAGVSVVPNGQGNTTLDLSFLIGGAAGGSKSKAYRDLRWMTGDRVSDGTQPTLVGAHIDATIYARDAATRSLVWTGTISCTIKTADPDALADGLGRATGKALGKSLPRAPL